jgi:hypothetical protein
MSKPSVKILSKSPERHSFQAKSYVEKLKEDPNDKSAQDMLDLYRTWREEADARELSPEWQENNMEYDMRTCDWMLEKVRASEVYSQHLYAAMCNREFRKLDVIPILKETSWSCSWRSAGGIVANMRQEGDYIDWYCSGIGDGLGNGDADRTLGYVSEGYVTDEIREDLQKLGWIVLPDDMDD